MKGSHREEPFEGVVQFGENPACRLESTRFRVWDFSEIPYLNKSLKKTIETQARRHSQEFFMSSISRSAKMAQPFLQSTLRHE